MGTQPSTFYHLPVLLNEAIAALNIRTDGVYVDATLGGGGHTREILNHLGPKGRLVVFDQDPDAWENAPTDQRVILVRENFKYLQRFLKLHGIAGVDGILADLGVSSFQFDTAARGFSIRWDAALDMRMDQRSALTAAAVIETYSALELQQIFEQYGEVRNARTLAETIVSERKKSPIRTIADFKGRINSCVRGNPNRYLAQVFQALRIEVNAELDVLKDFLLQTTDCIKPGGRLAVITFHSLEDRIVKLFLKQGDFHAEREKDAFGKPLYAIPFKALGSVLPGAGELKVNGRSRSARLRIGERI